VGLLEGKVGLVTGASSGLGRATSNLASEEGSKVVLVDINDEAGEAAAEVIRKAGGHAIYVHADVTKPAEVEAMVAATVSEFGRLDWASNNAVGGGGAMKLLHETDNAVWSSTMDVCLDGVFNCMKAEVPAMMEAGGGSIVNIITASVFKGEAMLGAYIAAKGGVDALTRTGAAEYAGCGIRVNSVAPGGFETPQIANYFRKFPEHKEKTINQHAMRRIGQPREVAEPVIWLASDRASFVTGICIPCEGGINVNSHLL
jgi:NAD(P)-dependent dehydrogenase (short-subunit alcohol dehydrogenase family)